MSKPNVFLDILVQKKMKITLTYEYTITTSQIMSMVIILCCLLMVTMSEGMLLGNMNINAPSTILKEAPSNNTYSPGLITIGLNDDENISPNVTKSVNRAITVLSNIFDIKVPISAAVIFTSLGYLGDYIILGSGAPTSFVPINGILYPIALAKNILGTGSEGIDIIIFINTNGTKFYYADDDSVPPPGYFDFTSVLMHEMIHGMGFIGTIISPLCTRQIKESDALASHVRGCQFSLSSSYGSNFSVYDHNIVEISGSRLTDIINASPVTAGNIYDAGELYFNTSSSYGLVNLYTPSPWVPGQSLYHMSSIYLSTSNTLMCNVFNQGGMVRTPGILGLAMLQKLGWTIFPSAIANAIQLSNNWATSPSPAPAAFASLVSLNSLLYFVAIGYLLLM